MALSGEIVGEMIGAGASKLARAKTSDGSWRPDLPFNSNHGLKVTMRRAVGLTPRGVLKVPLRFQVPSLGEHRRPYRFNWATFDTVSGGQRSRPMGAQLLEVQIDTMLLDAVASNASYGIVVWDGAADPERTIEELRFIAGVDNARKGKAAPFRLVIDQPAVWRNPTVSMISTLTSVEPAIPPGEVGTQYLSVSFLQYSEMRADEQRTHEREAQEHRLASGDTLYALAKRYLHQASSWRDIAAANGLSGVSPRDAGELAAWAKRHHVKVLKIPPAEFRGRRVGGGLIGAAAGP